MANAQTIVVDVFSASATGRNTGDVAVPMGVLLGDTTGNGTGQRLPMLARRKRIRKCRNRCQFPRRRQYERRNQRYRYFGSENEFGNRLAGASEDGKIEASLVFEMNLNCGCVLCRVRALFLAAMGIAGLSRVTILAE